MEFRLENLVNTSKIHVTKDVNFESGFIGYSVDLLTDRNTTVTEADDDLSLLEDSLSDRYDIVCNEEWSVNLILHSHIHKEMVIKCLDGNDSLDIVVDAGANDWGIARIKKRRMRFVNILSKNLLDVMQKKKAEELVKN